MSSKIKFKTRGVYSTIELEFPDSVSFSELTVLGKTLLKADGVEDVSITIGLTRDVEADDEIPF